MRWVVTRMPLRADPVQLRPSTRTANASFVWATVGVPGWSACRGGPEEGHPHLQIGPICRRAVFYRLAEAVDGLGGPTGVRITPRSVEGHPNTSPHPDHKARAPPLPPSTPPRAPCGPGGLAASPLEASSGEVRPWRPPRTARRQVTHRFSQVLL